jgi:hypothetical protein
MRLGGEEGQAPGEVDLGAALRLLCSAADGRDTSPMR